MIRIPMQLQLVIIFFQFFLFDLYILYNCFFLIYYVSIVIDPQFKLGYYQKQEWEQYYIDAAKKNLPIHSKIFIKIILMMLTTKKILMMKVIFSLIYWEEIITTIITQVKRLKIGFSIFGRFLPIYKSSWQN